MFDIFRHLTEKMAEYSILACLNMFGSNGTEKSTASYDVTFFSSSVNDALPLAVTIAAFVGMGAVLFVRGFAEHGDQPERTHDQQQI